MAKTILNLFKNKIFNLRPAILKNSKVHYGSRLAVEETKPRFYFSIKHYVNAEAVLNEYQDGDNSSLSWSNIIKDLTLVEEEAKIKLDTVILNSCLNLNLTGVAASYYEFLLNNGKTPKLIDTYLFLALFAQNPSQIIKNENILLRTFDVVKEYLPLQPSLLAIAADVYCMIPTRWKIMKDKGYFELLEKKSALIAGGFNSDEPETAWSLLNSHPQDLNNVVTETYLNYCTRKAQKKEFSISLVNDLIDFCKSKTVVLKHENLLEKFKELTHTLNSDSDSDIEWTVQPSFVNQNGYCSNCRKKLKKVTITKKEINQLKNEFLNDVIIGKDINLKTTAGELNKFKHYLETCGPYDIVIDGLNLSCLVKKHNELQRIVDYFLQQKLQILIIGKKLLLSKKNFLQVKNKCKYYFIDKLSDDDVFIIYAALSRGPDCYFLTKDYFRGYVDHLKDTGTKRTFMKWMVSHQYISSQSLSNINPPQQHAGLSQLTVRENNDRVLGYHFSENFQAMPKLNIPINWICLQGSPRNKGKVNNSE